MKRSKNEKNRKSLRSASRKTFDSILTKKPIVQKPRFMNIREWIFSDKQDPMLDEYVLLVIRDFFIYVIFVFVTSIIVFAPVGLKNNYFADILSDTVVKSHFESSLGQKIVFHEIRKPAEFWDFTQQVLVEVLYEPRISYRMGERRDSRVLTESILFGAPRIRQIRVRNQTCSPVSMFVDVFNECADYYREDVEDKEPFGLSSAGWTHDPPMPDSAPYRGKLSTYTSGGYSVNFSGEKTFTMQWLDLLETNNWIRFGTRAVFVEFTLFNKNTGMFCFAKLIFEIPPLGGIIPSYQFNSLKLLRYAYPFDYFIAACEIVFLCFIAYFTFDEIQQIALTKQRYFNNWWNILSIAIVLAAYIHTYQTVSCTLYCYDWVHRNLEYIYQMKHVSGDRVINMNFHLDLIAAVLMFVVWTKLLKYAILNRTATLYLGTLTHVRSEIITVTVMFVCVVTGFALFARINFGGTMREFHTFTDALAHMIGMLCGAFRFYHPSRSNNSNLGIFVTVFIFAIIVIFLNAYVALIVYGYELQLSSIDDLKTLARANDVFREMLRFTLKTLHKERLAESIKDTQLIKQRMRIYKNLVAILKRNNFSFKEISLILKKYGLSYHSGEISVETMCQIYDEIAVRNQLFFEVDNHTGLRKSVDQLSKTSDAIEMSLASLIDKVDLLIKNLTQPEIISIQ